MFLVQGNGETDRQGVHFIQASDLFAPAMEWSRPQTPAGGLRPPALPAEKTSLFLNARVRFRLQIQAA
jgi:hypothetical protein